MITKSGRPVIFIATLIMAIVITGVVVAMIMETDARNRGYFAETADAIYKTNTQVSIINKQTPGDAWTKTLTMTFTPMPNRQ